MQANVATMAPVTPAAFCTIEPASKSEQSIEQQPMPEWAASAISYFHQGCLPVTLIALTISIWSLWALSDVFPSGGVWTIIQLAFGLGVFKASEWACNMAFAVYAMFVLMHRGVKKLAASHSKHMHSIGEDY
ncbi:hypothetical protein CLAFUW4_11832 [Fulvia fulva]|uniref:Uncharacterized protein n=1 Tax=Passalora fulva TaxID=5499 RepID=A0A9Q8PDK9_PASFU|nr:uncharacterized protein CLAFUR5_10874 [Fulvia fulva]KAK4617464.1 hypothetical protein CLAFUR4_11837 [Fulvia fulva]KAK4618957.1 hypothetical protein CLAFUR0_11850 [Fulvia fulva]UJO20609.1 hypothetical protein CLAFUR5_10874 [Fulvia fulva]WPV18646.1 hypothetical protein CLAFUW4_11832 [Fulvia fulva]WPV33562.1 hypothetical protein CLAFUW7_11839 [Fulvia fulva]